MNKSNDDKTSIIPPWDLSTFAPYGNGVLGGEGIYGYQESSFEPIRGAPPQESSSGVVYFDNNVSDADFEGFLRMMNIKSENKDYATFIQESSNPLLDKYFNQMRLVSKFGLRFMFNSMDNNEYDSFKEHDLSIKDNLLKFMETEREKFGTSFGDPRIEGKMGGDGNYAREALSFGFMVENEYHKVYRIWSRAWLVTK